MPKPRLTAEELELAIRVARAMADGPFIDDFEFLAVTGFERTEFRALVAELETGAKLERSHERVIGSAMLGAVGFPHRQVELLERMTGSSMASIREVDLWWDRTRRAVKVRQSSLIAGPTIVDGVCYRGVHYVLAHGEGWFTEIWHDGRWISDTDYPDDLEQPGLPTLVGLPRATDDELARHGVTRWNIPPLYNPFVRGVKRRQRRKWRARVD